MHTRELMELAALVATHAQSFVRDVDQIAPGGVRQYWMASKCRLDRWAHAIKNFNLAMESHKDDIARQRPAVRSVIEEILTGEMLTRVWAAVACAHDSLHGSCELEPVARSIFVGHLEARHRALNLMVNGQGLSPGDAVELNRLRRKCERWSDLLVGQLVDEFDLGEFAFDVEQASDFARDLRDEQRACGEVAWQLAVHSMREAFRSGISESSPSPDLNARIAAGVLRCFDWQLLESTGMAKSLWLVRIENKADDTQAMLDKLLADAI